MDCTVHGILQDRILELVAIPFSRGSSQHRDQTQVSHIAGRFFTSWATKEAMFLSYRKSLPPFYSSSNCSGLKTSLSTMLPWSPAPGEWLQWRVNTLCTLTGSWSALLPCPCLPQPSGRLSESLQERVDCQILLLSVVGPPQDSHPWHSPFSPVKSVLTIGLVVLPSPLLPVPLWWGCSSFLPCPEEWQKLQCSFLQGRFILFWKSIYGGFF